MVTVRDLRALAAEHQIKGRSKMKKRELEDALQQAGVPIPTPVKGVPRMHFTTRAQREAAAQKRVRKPRAKVATAKSAKSSKAKPKPKAKVRVKQAKVGPRPCPSNQIRNPISKRCVKKSGTVGQLLIHQRALRDGKKVIATRKQYVTELILDGDQLVISGQHGSSRVPLKMLQNITTQLSKNKWKFSVQ